jgi:methionine--tRNA ligase beta chain
MGNISFDEFKKLELRVGKILSAARVEKSEKLLQLQVDFGEEKRQVISGIAKSYSPESLVGKSFVFVTNLEPRTIMGLASEAMILAGLVDDKPICLVPTQEVPSGTLIS